MFVNKRVYKYKKKQQPQAPVVTSVINAIIQEHECVNLFIIYKVMKHRKLSVTYYKMYI